MKKNRHEKIVEIIESRSVETQEELAEYLKEAGFHVTQATVSRDIRELNLSKITDENGKQKYVVFGKEERHMGDKYNRVLKEGYVSMDVAQNLVVIRTVAGMAMAAAAALDAMKLPGVLGCIAGDDTIMAATHNVEEAEKLVGRIREMLEDSL